jgi:hypothetical protein
MNIFDKFFDIMNEYEDLLLNKNINFNTDDNITDEDIINNKDMLSKQMNDNFFKYIFENINIKNKYKNLKDDNLNVDNLNVDNLTLNLHMRTDTDFIDKFHF